MANKLNARRDFLGGHKSFHHFTILALNHSGRKESAGQKVSPGHG
jgi:hypothetical protein